MERSSTLLDWGIATGKPFGRPIACAMRVIRMVRGWGVVKVMRRPEPVVVGSKVVEDVSVLAAVMEEVGDGVMMARVWGMESLWKVWDGRG